jgi:hypothetical protein
MKLTVGLSMILPHVSGQDNSVFAEDLWWNPNLERIVATQITEYLDFLLGFFVITLNDTYLL